MSQLPKTSTEVFQRVQGILAEELGKEPEEVKRTSRIFPDLGAESIDLIGILFLTEQRMKVRISRKDDFPLQELEDEELSLSDPLTPKAINGITKKMPYIGESLLLKQGASFEDIFTAEFYAKIVAHKMGIPWP